MSDAIIRSGSKLCRLGMFVLRKGGVYKDDLFAYANSMCSCRSNASALIKELQERDIVCFKDFAIADRIYVKPNNERGYSYRAKTKKTSVCFLTEHGIEAMYHLYAAAVKSEGSPARPRAYFENLRDQYAADFSSLSDKAYRDVLNLYNANHIKTFFNLCGIQTEEMSKPSLEQIFAMRNGLDYTHDAETLNPEFSPEDYASRMQKGCYYTIGEYRKFFAKHGDGLERFATIARGIYISESRTLVVYSNGMASKSMIYCPGVSPEQRLLDNLKHCNLSYNKYVRDEKGNDILNAFGDRQIESRQVHLLALADSESFVYSTAAGKRYGRTTKRHKSTNFEKSLLTPNSPLVKTSSENDGEDAGVFDGFYCAIWNRNGLRSFKLFLDEEDASYEGYYRKLIKTRKNDFKVNQAGWPYPVLYRYREDEQDKGYWYPCCYMPIYELKLLSQMRAGETTPIVITDASMTDTIQHVTHKQHVFLDAATLEERDSDDILIYDKKGYPAGKKLLEEYLASKNRKASVSEYKALPGRYQMSYSEFYNSIADGTVSLEDAEEKMTTTERVQVKHSHKKKRANLNQDLYDQIVELARSKDKTISYILNGVVRQGLASEKSEDT